MDLAVRLSRAVESTGHKRVIFGCIAENHQFGIAHAHVIFGQLCSLAHHAAHQANGVHIDAGFGGTDVDAGADQVGFGQRTGNAFDQTHIAGGKALMHQSTVTADKVDADRLGSGIQRFGKPHGVGVRCSAQQHGDGRYADALVDNGNAIVRADLVDNGNQVPRQTGDFVIDFLTGFFAIGINAVQQADAHGNGTHIKVFCGQHLDGFQDIAAVQNFHRVPPLHLVHRVKDFLPSHSDLHSHLLAQCVKTGADFGRFACAGRDIHQHNHAEHILQDTLGNILNVDVQLGTHGTYAGNNTHGIVADNSDNSFHDRHPSLLSKSRLL